MRGAQLPAMSLMLAGSLCLLPFLLPYHQQPLLSFYPEWLAVALGTAAVLTALAGRRFPAVTWPAAARWLVVFAAFLAVQAASGPQAYPQLPLLAVLYVLYAVLLIWLGAQLAGTLGIERAASVLAAFLLAGALANAVSGILQFYGRPALLEDLVAELRGNRAYGNIAQANLYADYLALGESALLFLWLRARVRSAYALPALALLVIAAALSASRGILLYALWFAVLGSLAGRVQDGAWPQRLKFASYGVATAAIAAYFAVPWLNGALPGPGGADALDRLLDYSAETRWQVWLLALRAFAGAPIAGVGVGEFPHAAFELGLDPSLTRSGEVWTSPHNLPLHLLAETGAVGATLVLVGLCVWGAQAARSYRAHPHPALWWAIAGTGVELIHSMIEFPMWSAHFLGVIALLIGASARPDPSPGAMSRSVRIAMLAACAALAITLGVMLGEYVRLDTARVTGTTMTLADPGAARRDAATMRELSRGLMGPLAELWIVMGAPLDRNELAGKRAMSERAVRYWPANAVVVRGAVFLAFDGEASKAHDLLARGLRTFPQQREATIRLLEQALPADPEAIGPLLAAARSAPSSPDTR